MSLLPAARSETESVEVGLLFVARSEGLTWAQIAEAMGFRSPRPVSSTSIGSAPDGTGNRDTPFDELLVLHAVRLEGFGDFEVIAKRAGTVGTKPLRCAEAERVGWVQNAAFADLEGWSLTDSGKVENERQLAAERRWADTADVVTAVYREFLPLNARLLRAVTDWQIAPTDTDRFAPNRHTDPEWDARVLAELTALSRELAP